MTSNSPLGIQSSRTLLSTSGLVVRVKESNLLRFSGEFQTLSWLWCPQGYFICFLSSQWNHLSFTGQVECALCAYITGIKSTHPNNFTAVEFGPCYQYHLIKLEHLEKHCPTWLGNMKKELYQSIWYVFQLLWFIVINLGIQFLPSPWRMRMMELTTAPWRYRPKRQSR